MFETRMLFSLLSRRTKETEIERLYREYGPHLLDFFQWGSYKVDGKPIYFRFPKEKAEDLTQDTFIKIMPKIEEIKDIPESKKKAYVFKTAVRLAISEFKKLKESPIPKNDGRDEEVSQEEWLDKQLIKDEDIPRVVEAILKILCIQHCKEKALAEYIEAHPEAVCLLVVVLSHFQRLIEEIADIVSRTVPETQKLLEQGSEKHYQTFEEYLEKYPLKSQCCFLIYLREMGYTAKEIGEKIGKSERTVQRYIRECQEKGLPYPKRCVEEC